MKVYGNCEICKEPIALGDMTLHKSGQYLCANCQIDLNNEIAIRDIYRKRRNEIMMQLNELNKELGVNEIDVV